MGTNVWHYAFITNTLKLARKPELSKKIKRNTEYLANMIFFHVIFNSRIKGASLMLAIGVVYRLTSGCHYNFYLEIQQEGSLLKM